MNQGIVRGENGFTFLETLLVLFITLILISIASVTLLPLSDSRKAKQFVEQFCQDIAFMQQAAISNNSRYSLRMYTADHKYVITKSGEVGIVLLRSYDPAILIDIHTMPNPLTYGQDGNINKAGSMYVQHQEITYRVVFQLGRGRMYYHEE